MIIKVRVCCPKIIICFSNPNVCVPYLQFFLAGNLIVNHRHIRNLADRKNRPVCICKSPDFTDSPKKGKHAVVHFHPGKCKKYYFVFKNKCLKKLLVLIVFKRLDYQVVLNGLVNNCFSCSVKQHKLHFS